VNTPTPARIYNALTRGKDAFKADRKAAGQLRKLIPDIEFAALRNRDFVERAVRFLAGSGIRQFIDIGVGLPVSGLDTDSVREVAREIAPEVRVAYVDNDPQVLVHARAVLDVTDVTAVLDGDLRDAAGILKDPALCELIDLGQPVGILLAAVIHFVGDEESPYAAVEILKQIMAPGSYLVISHCTADGISKDAQAASRKIYEASSAAVYPRSHGEVLRFFDGLDIVDPGVTEVTHWLGDPAVSSLNRQTLMYAGIGKKPWLR
jgi:S-adenosyl methyltransferase